MAEPSRTKAALIAQIDELKAKLAYLEGQKRFCNEACALCRIGVWEYDVVTDATVYSDSLYHLFGYELKEVEASKLAFLERVEPEDKARLQAIIEEACANNAPFVQTDYRVSLPSGVQNFIHTNINFTYDADGKLLRMIGSVQDITEAKRSEEQLRRSEENFRRLMESNPVAIAVTNKEGQCMTANLAMVKIFGYDSEEDFKSVPVYKHYHDIEDRKRLYAALERDGKVMDFPVTAMRKDGSLYFGELTSVYIKTKEVGYELLTMFVDTTERRRHEAELKKTVELLNLAQKMSQMGSYDWDLVSNVIIGSDEAYRIFGYNKDALKVTYEVFIESVHPDDKDHVIKSLNDAISNKTPLDMEYRILRAGSEERHIHGRGIITYDHDGKPIKMAGTVHDVTEKRKLDAELLRSQKLESIGRLAGGIAHDFNNLLLGIIGNVSLAKNFVKQDDRVFTFLNNIEKTAMRTKDLTSQILTFSKGGEPIRELLPIKQLLRDCAALVLRGSNIECNYDLSENLPNVEIDEGQISQVFNNIFLNARHATLNAGSREINIAAKAVHVTKTDGTPLPDGDYVRISIKDSGAGIPPEIIHKIFDPFFTTQERASGLGLAVAYSVIKKHGGHIGVESKPGQGATFNVYLPAVATVRTEKSATTPQEIPASGGDKVLVMDDEEVVRDVTGEMLKLIGYRAEFAIDGSQVIEMYKKAYNMGAPYAAVIMDLTIPGAMGGKEAIDKLIAINPKIKVIVSSGFSKDPIMSNYKKYGFAGVLAKPYRVSEFSRIVREVLAGEK